MLLCILKSSALTSTRKTSLSEECHELQLSNSLLFLCSPQNDSKSFISPSKSLTFNKTALVPKKPFIIVFAHLQTLHFNLLHSTGAQSYLLYTTYMYNKIKCHNLCRKGWNILRHKFIFLCYLTYIKFSNTWGLMADQYQHNNNKLISHLWRRDLYEQTLKKRF